MDGVYAKASHILEQWFATEWEDKGTGLPVAYENAPFIQPGDGKWVRMSVQFGAGQQASLGPNPMERTTGVVFLQFFWPRKQGTRQVRDAAGKGASVLRYQRFTVSGITIHLRAPSIGVLTEGKDGENREYYQLTVSVPFEMLYRVEIHEPE